MFAKINIGWQVPCDCFCLSFFLHCGRLQYNAHSGEDSAHTKTAVSNTRAIQFNTTAGNQKQRSTPFRKRKSNSTSLHNYSSVKMRASTAMSQTQPPLQNRCKSNEKQTTVMHTLNNSKPNHDNQHKKRKHITDNIDNSYGMPLFVKNNEKEINKTQQISERRKSEVGMILQSKRSTVGPISITSKINHIKKSRTGKQLMLNDLHFQSWLNEVLLESCEQKFDRSISLCALKKYMIDSASLAAFGINEAELSRIYRGLHVYSVGFSNLLKQIKGVSKKAYLNIWRVYSILLQHSSTGDFQTTMQEMENQNVRKLQKLEDELQEKQEIIELNRQKNSKIFKQIKALKEQNFQLVLQKDVINNDCREFEKAFNEEVSLRMLFEQKISSLYCVYNELSNKHSVLYKDFHVKTNELQTVTEQNKRIIEENSRVKKQIFGVQSDNKILVHQNTQLKEQLARLEEQHRKRSTQESELKLQRLNMSKQLLESQQECKKMGKQVQIIAGNNKLLRQTYHMLQKEYQQSLNENRKLLSTLQEQFSINKQYFQERQKLDRGLVNYQNQKAIYQLKISDRQKIIDELKDKIKALEDKINDMQREREIVQENIAKLNEDVGLGEHIIKKLKVINDQNQIIINQQQTKITMLEEQLLKLTIHKQRSEDTHKKNNQKINDLECKNKALSAEIQILNEKLALEIKARQKGKQIDLADRKKDQKQLNFLKKDNLNKQIELDKIKQLYESTMQRLKNERFEMKNLEMSYKQCLTVIENSNKVIKDINSKYSDLEDQLDQERRTKKIIELNYNTQFKRLNTENKMLSEKTKELIEYTENKMLSEKTKELIEYNRKHKNGLHPMIIQDLYSHLQRMQQKQEQRQQLLSTLQTKIKEIEWKYKSSLSQREMVIIQLTWKIKQTEQKLTLQIQYERKKNVELSKELQEIELQLVGLKNIYKIPVQQFKEKQRKYLQIIKQKKQKVETLIDEIEVMHDKNHKLMEQITYSQKELSSQRQKLAEIQENLQVVQNEKQRAESLKDLAIHQVGEIIKEFKLEIPEHFGPHKQIMDLIKKNNGNTQSDVYLRQTTKSIDKHGVEAYRETKDIQNQTNNEKRENEKYVTKNSSEREKRQDFVHKFKHASHYYMK